MGFLVGLAVALIVALATPGSAHAQDEMGSGLIVALDASSRSLTLETRLGTRTIVVPTATSIRGDGRTLAWADLAPGDAVVYIAPGGRVTRLAVACQYWAVPPGP